MDFTTKNKGDRTSLPNFESDLVSGGLLRLKPFMKKNIRGIELKQFIINLLSDYNSRIPTVYSDSDAEQCEPDKRRSGGDIFLICKYYYPTCNLREVMMILDEIHGGDNITSSMCSQINKRVYRHDPEEEGNVYNESEKDEFNRTPGEYLNGIANEH